MSKYDPVALEGVLSLDITNVAQQIEMECADWLQPAPKGIYVRGRLEPAMVDGTVYYTRVGTNTVPVVDINTTTENVYNNHDKLVIPKTYLVAKEKFLRNDPTLPYRGIKIIECLTNELVDNFLQFRSAGHTWHERMLRTHFAQPVEPLLEGETHQHMLDWQAKAAIYNEENQRFEEAYEAMSAIYQLLKNNIELFLDGKSWHMHTVRLTNTLLTIERYCDWRVHQWEQEHGETFRTGRTAPTAGAEE